LVDRNTGERFYESADIIAYLTKTYGQGLSYPARRQSKTLDVASSVIASGYRAGAGLRARPSKEASQPLELYSFESSPYARRVRESLCELELPYVLHNVGRTQLIETIPPSARDFFGLDIRPTSINRQAFLERSGRMMVPYLIDPNTSTEMFESNAIRDYLVKNYAT
jgi:glutathione S-transferase